MNFYHQMKGDIRCRIISPTVIPKDEWTHIAVTKEYEFVTFYVNSERTHRGKIDKPNIDYSDSENL